VRGIDVLVREGTHIPVDPFDGSTLPYAEGAFDIVLFVDVLHHADDPMSLLREARRVARRAIVIKDHTNDRWLADPILRFMDAVGNERHGVRLPFNYWPKRKWMETFESLGLTLAAWKSDLRLYPLPADWIFGGSLHFVARLDVPGTRP
jgi:SAM-dependent methyltransferase